MDIYHAREHLHALAAQLTPALGDQHPDWLTARLADLDAGDIETLVAQTERLHRQLSDNTAHDTAKALAYFKTNAHRMRYRYFRDHRMFIGSGTVEAGCKADAKKYYSAIQFQQRRAFVKNCIDRAYR